MNYYIIPKNNFEIHFDFECTSETPKPVMSYSLIFYLNNVYSQMIAMDETFAKQEKENIRENTISFDYINKIINPYEFIYTNIPGSPISVSKVKPESNIFFELIEVFQLFGINEMLSCKTKMNVAHLTPNNTSTRYLLDMLREDHQDNVISEVFDYDILRDKFINNHYTDKLDLLICEFPLNDYAYSDKYIYNILLVFCIIIKCQAQKGVCIIKIENVFYKVIVDVLFIMSKLYDKVFLIKPCVSDITRGDRYIICKSYCVNKDEENKLLDEIEENIIKKLHKSRLQGEQIKSLISNSIPCHFLNKLEELNAIIGQQQLEAYDQIINIYKNKNREEKLEVLKRNHIQRCIQWCEKNQLPHNKFIDKVNIFLVGKDECKEQELEN